MNVIPLIGAHLKSDDIIDLLEQWEAVVVYDFDRLHENTPDCYRVTLPSAGMEFLFDANQILETLFLRIVSTDDFNPFDITNSDFAFWKTTVKQGSTTGPRGQPFPQPGSKALEEGGDPTTIPSGPTGRSFNTPRGRPEESLACWANNRRVPSFSSRSDGLRNWMAVWMGPLFQTHLKNQSSVTTDL